MKENGRTQIALPNGEFRSSVLTCMSELGFTFDAIDRGLIIPVSDVLEFALVRATNVPDYLASERSKTKAGITGSDILWERGTPYIGTEFPIYDITPSTKQPSLFLGVSEEFESYIRQEYGRDVKPQDIDGKILATKFVNIADEYCKRKRINNIELLYVPGSDEAMPYIFPDCIAILGTKSSGKTSEINNIRIIDEFYRVTLQMIEAADDKLNAQDRLVLDDLQERIAIAVMRKQPVITRYL